LISSLQNFNCSVAVKAWAAQAKAKTAANAAPRQVLLAPQPLLPRHAKPPQPALRVALTIWMTIFRFEVYLRVGM
jgi:hypothetical protein